MAYPRAYDDIRRRPPPQPVGWIAKAEPCLAITSNVRLQPGEDRSVVRDGHFIGWVRVANVPEHAYGSRALVKRAPSNGGTLKRPDGEVTTPGQRSAVEDAIQRRTPPRLIANHSRPAV